MSCPNLSKIQQSDFLCDSTVGADADPAAVAAWQIQLQPTHSPRGSSGLHRQKNALLMQIMAISQMAKALWCQQNGTAVMPLPHRR